MENSSKRKRLRAPSPAMMVACIALAIALSGVGYAAVAIPRNSVGTAQLKNNAVSTAKIQSGAIGGGKVKDDSLSGDDIFDGSLSGDDVANDSLTGADVEDGTLSGDDIDQASLNEVDAATLGGLTSDDYAKATPTGYDAYVASGSSWVDRDGAARDHVTLTSSGKSTGCTTTGASTGTEAAAYQDVHLPHGARITEMSVDFRDDAGVVGSNGTVSLVRQPIFSSSAGTNATILSTTLNDITPAGSLFTASDTQVPPLTPEFGIVDNESYAYTLLAAPGTLTGVAYCSVRVMYELP